MAVQCNSILILWRACIGRVVGILFGVAIASAAATGPSLADGLYFSEVAVNYRAVNDRLRAKGWIEIVNKSDKPVDLGSYRLRAWGLNRRGRLSDAPLTFALPQKVLPPGGYHVLAGKLFDALKGNDKSSYIVSDDGRYFPYWSDAAGFVELLSADGKTVDFVRFGTETTAPITVGSWTGKSVPAFPAIANYQPSQSMDPLDNYDRSIVRRAAEFRTTGTKEDWTHVAFPTPSGPNDVPPEAVDADKDGIPNTAKVAGGTFAGLDLYAMGARPGQRDLFIHLEHLQGTNDPGLVPQRAALDKVVQAFKGHNIHVHFDVGNLFGPALTPADYNLSGDISFERPFIKCTQLPRGAADAEKGCSSLYEYSSDRFDVRRRPIFRFGLLASSQLQSGEKGKSGRSELPGNKFLVTLGQWRLSTQGEQRKNVLTNFQAGTIMHELGHTLGLRHGGFEDGNYKPNYFSIMNYLYQLRGLPASAAGMGPTQRYYYTWNHTFHSPVPGHGTAESYRLCDVPDGPCLATMIIDYSDGSGKSLDEAALDERQNIGRGADADAFADWNLNAGVDANTYARSITGDQGPLRVLRDHDDWSALTLVSGRSYATALQAKRHADPDCRTAPRAPASRLRCWSAPSSARIVVEPTPPIGLFNDLQRMEQERR